MLPILDVFLLCFVSIPLLSETLFLGSATQAFSSCFFISQVMILITGAHKAFALYKAIEEGVNHMWTVSAFQQHPQAVFVCDEDATLELRVKTVKYFQGDAEFTMLCVHDHISL